LRKVFERLRCFLNAKVQLSNNIYQLEKEDLFNNTSSEIDCL